MSGSSRVDSTLLWLNIMRLPGVILVPFSTSVNNDYSAYVAGRLLLPLNFLFVIVLGAAQWFYATRRDRPLVDGRSPEAIRRDRAGSVAAVVTGILVVALAPLIGSIAFALFVFNPVMDRVIGWLMRSRGHGDAHSGSGWNRDDAGGPRRATDDGPAPGG